MNGFTEQDFFGENSREATGAGTVIAALEEAVSRPDVSAIVLRVDSPGGDAMASDHIYHAVEAAVKKKPVVVSMGSYAASGGYYVAAPAQKIFAQPLTLTGSIGVYALSVNAERALQKLKIGRFDVRRGDLQNGSLLQAMNEAELLRLQEHIDDTYRQFLEAVANGRDMPLERVKEIAEGRVWTGVQAQEKGLVDHLGHLQDAVLAAASEAKIDLDATPVELILLGHGDLPMTEGFKALAPKTTRQSLEAKALRAVGLSDAEIHSGQARARRPTSPTRSSSSKGKGPMGKRILLVDDDPHLLSTVQAFLNDEQFQVFLARNYDEALEKIQKAREEEKPFHLYILDVLMPGKNGLELGKEIAEGPTTPPCFL